MLFSFTEHKGSMNLVYTAVMLSDPLEDEERFREIIDQAIKDGNVRAYKLYVNETEKSKEARMRNASKEGVEAMEYAKELGVADKLFGKQGGGSGEDALAALIQKRQQGRSNFLENLEAKYSSKAQAKTKGRKSKKRSSEHEGDEDEGEPSEEAFQAAAARLSGRSGETNNGRRSKRAKN